METKTLATTYMTTIPTWQPYLHDSHTYMTAKPTWQPYLHDSHTYMTAMPTCQPYLGWEVWSSATGRKLMLKWSWVRIPAPDTRWTFFTPLCCRNCNVCLKRPKIKEKEAKDGPFLKTARPPFRMVEKKRSRVRFFKPDKRKTDIFPNWISVKWRSFQLLDNQKQNHEWKRKRNHSKRNKIFHTKFLQASVLRGFLCSGFSSGYSSFCHCCMAGLDAASYGRPLYCSDWRW